jgi:hypothetical protein
MPPTFSKDIKPLFTQYERIKMMFFADLWNYNEVKANANNIWLSLQIDPAQPNTGWSLLPGVHVMPAYTGPWPQEQIDLFKAWIDGGCQPGDLPPTPPPPSQWLPAFIALSEFLTAFDDLNDDPALAQVYLDLLVKSAGSAGVEALLNKWNGIATSEIVGLESRVAKEIMGDATLGPLAQKLIILWYNATIDGQQQKDQYTRGRVWDAIMAHPMGYATENTPFYWQFYPEDGNYTGARAGIKPPDAPGNQRNPRT